MTYDTLAALIFVAFIAMLVAVTFSVAIRVGRWRVRHISPPTLLYRDLVGFSGLSFSFLAVMVARVLDIPDHYVRTVPWLIFTSVPALLGVGTFLYFEVFVIGHRDDRP